MKRVAIAKIKADGSVLAIWDDKMKQREVGGRPHRASRIEVVPEGKQATLFCVDFTPLYNMTGKPEYCVCLVQTFLTYTEANHAEVEWLRENYILKG